MKPHFVPHREPSIAIRQNNLLTLEMKNWCKWQNRLGCRNTVGMAECGVFYIFPGVTCRNIDCSFL